MSPPAYPTGSSLMKRASPGVVVPRPVVVQAGEAVVLPPSELVRIRERGIRGAHYPKRIIRILRHYTSGLVPDSDCAPQGVGGQEEGAVGVAEAEGLVDGERAKIARGALGLELLGDVEAVIEELGRRAVHGLGETPTEGVREAGHSPGLLEADQAIARVPGEVGRLGPVIHRGQVAVGVEGHLARAEDALAIGRVVGGAGDG